MIGCSAKVDDNRMMITGLEESQVKVEASDNTSFEPFLIVDFWQIKALQRFWELITCDGYTNHLTFCFVLISFLNIDYEELVK